MDEYRCDLCDEITGELTETLDEDTLERIWVCDECLSDTLYLDLEDPDCMID